MVSLAKQKKRVNNGVGSLKKMMMGCSAIVFGILVIFIPSNDDDASAASLRAMSTSGYFSEANQNAEYGVDETCTHLPTIRPVGSYFLDRKIGAGKSPDSVSPAFHVGSRYPDKVMYHMNADAENFHLIKEIIHEHGDSGDWSLILERTRVSTRTTWQHLVCRYTPSRSTKKFSGPFSMVPNSTPRVFLTM